MIKLTENIEKISPEKAWEAAMGQLKLTMDKQTFSTLMGKAELAPG